VTVTVVTYITVTVLRVTVLLSNLQVTSRIPARSSPHIRNGHCVELGPVSAPATESTHLATANDLTLSRHRPHTHLKPALPAITAGLATCEDTFEAWDPLNSTRPLDTGLRVLLAGLKLEYLIAAQWWCENRDVLKKSESWADFATAVKDRFVPASWCLDSLARFYAISQGSSSFSDFLARLQSARSAQVVVSLSTTLMKNHLLLNCNRLLSLRICAIPTLDYASLKVDNLIGLISSTWNSMVAENVGSARATPQPAVPVSSRSVLKAERDAIRNARGCFHCQKTPSSPGWTQHSSRNRPAEKPTDTTIAMILMLNLKNGNNV
jgi:hypothetical protein